MKALMNENRGFALPAAIFALVVVGVLITGGIHVATQESRVGQATERATRAFYIAESGMNEVLTAWSVGDSNLGVWDGLDQLSGTTAQGTWEATVRQVDDQMYFISTTGFVEAGAGPPAQRTVGVLARLATVAFSPSAALTIQGGVHAQGAPKKVDGSDQVPPGWGDFCPEDLDPKPGVMTNQADSVTASPWPQGQECPSQYVGTPCIQENNEEVEAQIEQMDELWFDLLSMAEKTTGPNPNPAPNPGALPGPCITNDPENWGDPLNPDGPCAQYYPIIYAPGNLTMDGSDVGQGILLVEGDFTMAGNALFSGIVMVQGEFSAASGTPQVRGAVTAKSASTLSGTPNIDYSSCMVSRSLLLNESLSRMRPVEERSWVDLTGATF